MSSQPTPGQGFSFKLNKKKEKFSAPIVEQRTAGDGAAEFITAIDGNHIESRNPVENKGPLVIPLIQNNNWRQQAKERNLSKKIKERRDNDPEVPVPSSHVVVEIKKEPGLSLDEKAQRELMDEAREFNENYEERSKEESKKVIPLLLMNKVPDGFEEDDNFDVSARPDNPTLDDYSKVPVEEFGMALLRGMGFKPEESKSVDPIEVKIRPKGLGLGAELPKQVALKSYSSSRNAEKLELKVGAHVLILAQDFKDFYATIEGFDEDLSRASVRLAINNLSVHVPVFALQLVPKEEFKKEGKVLNRSSYTKYKDEVGRSKTNGKEEHHEPHKESRGEPSSTRHRDESSSSWIHSGLRVRIIKKGRYYEQKVVIEDVLTPVTCCCLTDRKEKLEEIDAKMLETVVPRREGSKVMILKGEFKGEIGKLVERKSAEQEVTVQLISDPLIIEKYHFDHVCEFVH